MPIIEVNQTSASTRTELEAQIRRTYACLLALDRFRLAAIEEGWVMRLIESAVELTAETETLLAWCHNGRLGRLKQNERVRLGRVETCCRRVLDARAELGERRKIITSHPEWDKK